MSGVSIPRKAASIATTRAGLINPSDITKLDQIGNFCTPRVGKVTLTPGHLPEDQQKTLRAIALAYRRVMRSAREPASTRAEIARRDQKRQGSCRGNSGISAA